jgi:DNA-binding transcriptional MerR regulator
LKDTTEQPRPGPDRYVSIHDIARELDAGFAVTKLMLKRFGHRFTADLSGGYPRYAQKDLPLMRQINQWISAGMAFSQIETMLETAADSSVEARIPSAFVSHPEQVQLSGDGLRLIQSFLTDLGEHQKRLAAAQEKRAAAEERKAAAIEKRAAAEENKARAMDHIAEALKELSRQHPLEPGVQMVAHEAARAVESAIGPSGFTDPVNADPIPPPAADDLTALLDAPIFHSREMDDLSDLIDAVAQQPVQSEDPGYADRLTRSSAITDPSSDLDDLSTLVNTPLMDPVSLDNLSELIAPEHESGESVDDLTALLDTASSLRPGISRDENLEEYKAAVMTIIMDLKSSGLSDHQTAERLNRDGVDTISGKPEWTVAAITQIYKYIDAAG